MRKIIINSFIILFFSVFSFVIGCKVGYESLWKKDFKVDSIKALDVGRGTDWRKLTTLKGGYDVWEDAGSVAVAITKDDERIFLAMDRYNKNVLDGVVKVDPDFKKSEGLFVEYMGHEVFSPDFKKVSE